MHNQESISHKKNLGKKEILKQYVDFFQGFGCFQGEFHVTIHPSVTPLVHSPCCVLETVNEVLRKELNSLVAQGMLGKGTKSTDLVNSLVCVTKNNGHHGSVKTMRTCTRRSGGFSILRPPLKISSLN